MSGVLVQSMRARCVSSLHCMLDRSGLEGSTAVGSQKMAKSTDTWVTRAILDLVAIDLNLVVMDINVALDAGQQRGRRCNQQGSTWPCSLGCRGPTHQLCRAIACSRGSLSHASDPSPLPVALKLQPLPSLLPFLPGPAHAWQRAPGGTVHRRHQAPLPHPRQDAEEGANGCFCFGHNSGQQLDCLQFRNSRRSVSRNSISVVRVRSVRLCLLRLLKQQVSCVQQKSSAPFDSAEEQRVCWQPRGDGSWLLQRSAMPSEAARHIP